MKLKWLGHSCFEITLNNGKVFITDPYDDTVGYPSLHAKADAVLSSHDHFDHNYFAAIEGDYKIINKPGACECFGAKITGVHSFHDEVRGAKRGENIIFTLEADGVKLTHLGDLGHMPETEEQKSAIRGADVLLIPIGGVFTITTPEAVRLIEAYKPVAAIAMHYRNHFCGFDVSDNAEFIRQTNAVTLPNAVEVFKGALQGCYVMDI